MSNNEYEQQQFWNKMQEEFINKRLKDEFKSSFYDQIIFGESYIHITKDCARRIHPLSEEVNLIKTKLNGK